jgi:hypothetical protein
MQQHSSGQPPEKKLRVGGNYASADPTNYDYQVNDFFFFCIEYYRLYNLEKSKSTATDLSTTTTTTTTFLVCSSLYLYHTYYLFNSAFVV